MNFLDLYNQTKSNMFLIGECHGTKEMPQTFIKILKERDKSNTLKFYENKFYDRVYPSLCCIEKVFANDLDYSFELNNIWKNIF